MLGDEYGSLVLVATVSTVIIIFFSAFLRSRPVFINAVFMIVIFFALLIYSWRVHRSLIDTLHLLLEIVSGPNDSATRLCLVAFWLFNVAISLLFCVYVSRRGNSSTRDRKFFHLTVSLIYSSGILVDSRFTWLCYWLWMCIFVLVECLRFCQVPPWSDTLNSYLLIFKDAQDVRFLLTPIYLLVGIALPLMLSGPNTLIHLWHFSGVASVGVGDSFAAIVGSKFGRNKWNNSNKSVEGTISMGVSMLVTLFLLNNFAVTVPSSTISILAASIIASIVEAFVVSADNILLPLITYILL